VTDDLDLRLSGNGCKVGMQYASLVDRFSMAICSCWGIELARELVLGLRGDRLLVFDDNNLVFVECLA
jgi:hypothetical protein